MPTSTLPSFLSRLQFFATIFGGLYAVTIGIVIIPFFQTKFVAFYNPSGLNLTIFCSAIYLNRVRIPWFADFDAPEKYGLAR
jgi:abhydrolase domain-containing protein 12